MAAAKTSIISHRNGKFTAYDIIVSVYNGPNILLDGRFGYYFVETTGFIKRSVDRIFHKIRDLFCKAFYVLHEVLIMHTCEVSKPRWSNGRKPDC